MNAAVTALPTHDRLADAPLEVRRQVGLRDFAQIGQALGERTLRKRCEENEKNSEANFHCRYDTVPGLKPDFGSPGVPLEYAHTYMDRPDPRRFT